MSKSWSGTFAKPSPIELAKLEYISKVACSMTNQNA
jgi:hypothetical protein